MARIGSVLLSTLVSDPLVGKIVDTLAPKKGEGLAEWALRIDEYHSEKGDMVYQTAEGKPRGLFGIAALMKLGKLSAEGDSLRVENDGPEWSGRSVDIRHDSAMLMADGNRLSVEKAKVTAGRFVTTSSKVGTLFDTVETFIREVRPVSKGRPGPVDVDVSDL